MKKLLTDEQVDFLLEQVRKMEVIEQRKELIKAFSVHDSSTKLHRVLLIGNEKEHFEVTKLVEGVQVSKYSYDTYEDATERFDKMVG